jgi:hypothetical protein
MTKSLIPLFVAAAMLSAALWGQKPRVPQTPLPVWEVKEVLPLEVSPARYRQVSRTELDALARDGWELVAVTPYVYLNEERGTRAEPARPMVTQTYSAYYFKRMKRDRF